jgi:hypothetical protein
MFNILSHKGNANEDNTEIPSHPSQNGCHQGNKEQQVLVRMQGSSVCVCGSVRVGEWR